MFQHPGVAFSLPARCEAALRLLAVPGSPGRRSPAGGVHQCPPGGEESAGRGGDGPSAAGRGAGEREAAAGRDLPPPGEVTLWASSCAGFPLRLFMVSSQGLSAALGLRGCHKGEAWRPAGTTALPADRSGQQRKHQGGLRGDSPVGHEPRTVGQGGREGGRRAGCQQQTWPPQCLPPSPDQQRASSTLSGPGRVLEGPTTHFLHPHCEQCPHPRFLLCASCSVAGCRSRQGPAFLFPDCPVA